MARYYKKAQDLAYRKVNIASSITPEFQPFGEGQQYVDYPDTAVLEIHRPDGDVLDTSQKVRNQVSYQGYGAREYRLAQGAPRDRLWLRPANGKGIWYKVPAGLPTEVGWVTIRVPGGVEKWELVGDRYFEALYDLQKT